MGFAATNDYVVLTNDLDFAAILASSHHKKPSVVQIRAENLDPNVIGTQIVSALQRAQKELEGGALLTIEADRTRMRVLSALSGCACAASPTQSRSASFVVGLIRETLIYDCSVTLGAVTSERTAEEKAR